MKIETGLSHLIGEIDLYITEAALGPVVTSDRILFHTQWWHYLFLLLFSVWKHICCICKWSLCFGWGNLGTWLFYY